MQRIFSGCKKDCVSLQEQREVINCIKKEVDACYGAIQSSTGYQFKACFACLRGSKETVQNFFCSVALLELKIHDVTERQLRAGVKTKLFS